MSSAPLPQASIVDLSAGHDDAVFASFDTRSFRRFFRFVAPHRAKLLAALAAVLLSAAVTVAIPDMIRRAVDAVVEHRDPRLLDTVVLAFVALVMLNAVTTFLEQRTTGRLGQRVVFDIRRAMFTHLQDLSLGFLDKTHVGRIMSRIQGDVNAVQEFLEGSISAIGDLVVLLGIVVVLLMLDWRLGLLTLTVLPMLIGLRAVWLPFSRRTFQGAKEASSTANSELAENINGIRTVQESRREQLNFALYERKARANMDAQVGASAMAQIMVPTVDLLTGLAMAVVIVVGGKAVVGGRLDVGVMVAFIFYVQRFFDPVRTLSMQYTAMQQAMASAHRIFEVLDVPIAITDKPDAEVLGAEVLGDEVLGAEVLGDVESSVEFRNVTFGYAPGRPVLHDVSFSVRPGEVVALVGPTGSGKTSIISLTHRFYEVDEGQVLVGGHDVRDVTQDSLGRRIGMVLQEPFLFTGTIEAAIRYNTAGASQETVIAAAKAVRAHDFIMRLPDGYQTMLGQRGRNLSVGQRQLISFARALVADPQILILDEATANIDSFTELAVQQALKALFLGRTCIVIAHRLATIRDADRIIVLRQGRIVEQGPHEELMRRHGLYAQLYASAHASFDDNAVELMGDPEFATRS